VIFDLIENRKLRLSLRVTGFFYIVFAIWMPVFYVGKNGGVLTYILPVITLIATLVLVEMASQYKTEDDE
jgi:hypothetical protein